MKLNCLRKRAKASETLPRILAWFSCGDASAVAAKLAVEKYGDRCEVVYCDTLAYEHPDNMRFFRDVQNWIGKPIGILKSEEYRDIYDVYEKTGWLVGPGGARCTTELKKVVRKDFQRWDDIHIFGFTYDEQYRVDRFNKTSPELFAEFPLVDNKLVKQDCHRMVRDAGIELPAMYKLGYKNNNCIGCVKGGKGYWNMIRRDFPEIFAKMASTERKLNAAINKSYAVIDGVKTRQRVFLDELPANAGRMEPEPDIECNALCGTEEDES